MDEIRHWLNQQREIGDWCAHIFAETWLHHNFNDDSVPRQQSAGL